MSHREQFAQWQLKSGQNIFIIENETRFRAGNATQMLIWILQRQFPQVIGSL